MEIFILEQIHGLLTVNCQCVAGDINIIIAETCGLILLNDFSFHWALGTEKGS